MALIREERDAKGRVVGVVIDVKAVPGASRDQISGVLGERLKIRVSAPPEGGKANAAICSLLAGALGAPARNAEVIAGPTRAEKTVRVLGVDEAGARKALGLDARGDA